MDNWKWLFHKAMMQIQSTKIPDTSWSFGGGTSLMLQFNHRESKDIDIFIKDAQILTYLSPRVNDAVEDSVHRYAEQANYIRLTFKDRGEVDFICAGQVSSCKASRREICGYSVFVEDPIETIAKKIHYRGEEFTARDVFDLATVYKVQRQALLDEYKCMMPHREALIARIHKLHNSGELERECEQLAILPGGRDLRGKEMVFVKSFLSGLRESLTILK